MAEASFARISPRRREGFLLSRTVCAADPHCRDVKSVAAALVKPERS
jgi:hypothetical protein